MLETIVIALLLLVPIFIVIAILKIANRKRRKKAQGKILNSISEATKQTGITDHYQKQLIHQTVIIDEKNRKLLIIDHHNVPSSFSVYPLGAISSVEVINDKHSFLINGKGEKHERITMKIGIELTFEKAGEVKFLILYDYLEHNIYQMADLEKEAHQLQDTIKKAINGQPINK